MRSPSLDMTQDKIDLAKCQAVLGTTLQCRHYRVLQYSIGKSFAVYCSALQCIAVHCIAVQCSAVQCKAGQCSAVQRSAVQCKAVQCIAMSCPAARCKLSLCRSSPVNGSFSYWTHLPSTKVKCMELKVSSLFWFSL